MEYPVVLHAGTHALPAHAVLEFLAYPLGVALLSRLRTRWGDPLAQRTRLLVILAAAAGAVAGSKLLFLLERPDLLPVRITPPALFASGKSVVGGLLGGLAAVELAKRYLGERRSTGDLFVLPLCLGMAVGRVGCFLGGLADDTFGAPTSLPWGVDFGDGVTRHPTQLYEIMALAGIALWAIRHRTRAAGSGDVFKGFMVLYLGWRLFVDFLKPEPPPLALGLTAIQFACLGGIAYYTPTLRRVFAPGAAPQRQQQAGV